MKIIDGQMHDPAPWLDWNGHDEETQHNILTEITLAYLDATGVSGIVLFTPEEWGAAAAKASPERIAYVPSIDPDVPDAEAAVAEAKAKRDRGLLALRATIGWPLDGSEITRLQEGKWDPIFSACEKHHLPLFMFVTRCLPLAVGVAERYPDLTLIIDHLGLRQPPMDSADDPPFKSLPDLLALAKYPNVAVKMCGLPALSRQPFPFLDVVPELRSIVDAFGADRLMWASDIGRFYGRIGLHPMVIPGTQEQYVGKHTYAESMNFFRYCDQLTDHEKEAILGGSLTRLLGWP
jgi:L-fuconolactonase